MRKILGVGALALIVPAIMLAGCVTKVYDKGDMIQLETPVVEYSGAHYISWNAIPHAGNGYRIDCVHVATNQSWYMEYVKGTSYNLENLGTQNGFIIGIHNGYGGQYRVTVRAMMYFDKSAKLEYSNSNPSEPVFLTW